MLKAMAPAAPMSVLWDLRHYKQVCVSTQSKDNFPPSAGASQDRQKLSSRRLWLPGGDYTLQENCLHDSVVYP